MPDLKTRFGPYAPDLPAFDSNSSDLVQNCIPVAGGYRPVPSLLAFTEALPSRVLTSRYFVNEANTVAGFAATANLIFLANVEQFNDVSKAGGYNTAEGDVWWMIRDRDTVYATNLADPVQSFLIGASNNFADELGIPRNKFLIPIGQFLFALYIVENGTVNPFALQWSSRNNFANFPDPGTTDALQTQSDRRQLSSNFGDITGGAAALTSADGVIFQEKAVTSVRFVGGRRVFALDVIEGARGCTAPGSIVQVGGDVYYLDNAGIYRTDGVRSVPIGTKRIDRFIYDNVANTENLDVVAGTDLREKVIYWNLPGQDSNRFTLAYNYDVDEFTSLDETFDVTAFTESLTPGLTFDDLQRISPVLDQLPASLDSDLFRGGGLPVFSAFASDNRLGTLSGPNLAATLRTPEAELAEDERIYIQFSRPLIDTEAVTVRTRLRDRLSETTPRLGRAVSPNDDGRCLHRESGRYAALEMVVEAGADWSFAQGIQVIYARAGRRRPTVFQRTASEPLFLLADNGQLIITDDGPPVLAEIIVPPVEADLLVDEVGNFIVDEVGNRIRVN